MINKWPKSDQKVVKDRSGSGQKKLKWSESGQKVVKDNQELPRMSVVVKTWSKCCQKVVKKKSGHVIRTWSKSCEKIVKKLSKIDQEVVRKS